MGEGQTARCDFNDQNDDNCKEEDEEENDPR